MNLKKRRIALVTVVLCVLSMLFLTAFTQGNDDDFLNGIYVEEGEDILATFLESNFQNSTASYEETFSQYDPDGKWKMTEKINGDIIIVFKGSYNCIVPDSLVIVYTLYPMGDGIYFKQCTSVNYFGGGM